MALEPFGPGREPHIFIFLTEPGEIPGGYFASQTKKIGGLCSTEKIDRTVISSWYPSSSVHAAQV